MRYKIPIPEQTLAIIFGASAWPAYRDFQASASFANSAEALRDYLIDQEGFKLPPRNLKYMFDTHVDATSILAEMSAFLRTRSTELREQGTPPSDLLLYYVGHGGFANPTNDYFLAIRNTRNPDPYLSSVPIISLARTLKEEARYLRRYLILDSCFAAAAYRSFESSVIEIAAGKTTDSFPPTGTVLLCSSGPRDPSRAPEGLTYTMFSGALLSLLRNGNASAGPVLSFQDLDNLIRHSLRQQFDDEAVRPRVLLPDQKGGAVDDTPLDQIALFPNRAWRGASSSAAAPEQHAGGLAGGGRSIEFTDYRRASVEETSQVKAEGKPATPGDTQPKDEFISVGNIAVPQMDVDKYIQKMPGVFLRVGGFNLTREEWIGIPSSVQELIVIWKKSCRLGLRIIYTSLVLNIGLISMILISIDFSYEARVSLFSFVGVSLILSIILAMSSVLTLLVVQFKNPPFLLRPLPPDPAPWEELGIAVSLRKRFVVNLFGKIFISYRHLKIMSAISIAATVLIGYLITTR